jgi:hypothetical protein
VKKHLSKIVIAPAVLTLISGLVVFLLTTNKPSNYDTERSDNYRKPDYDYAALVYHEEFIGPDAATSYNYLIYPVSASDSSSYFYIKTKSQMTIAGEGKAIDVTRGNINKKSDLTKIETSIKRDKQKHAETIVRFYCIDSGKKAECDGIESFDDLVKKLFK